MKNNNGGRYFRLENATRTIALIGISEAVERIIDQKIVEDPGKAYVVTERILKHINAYTKNAQKNHTQDLQLPSSRVRGSQDESQN